MDGMSISESFLNLPPLEMSAGPGVFQSTAQSTCAIGSSEDASTGENKIPCSPPESASHPLVPEKTQKTEKASLVGLPSRELLSKNAQELIDELNNKRKQDTQLMSDFRKAMDEQVQKACSTVEQTLFGVYDRQSAQVQEKLQDLFATLDRISQLENELQQFKQALAMLYQDMSHDYK